MSQDGLLTEFPPVSTEAWDAAIQEDLKGADAATLAWGAEGGLELKPYYCAEDLAGLTYVRRGRASGDWRIREEVREADAEAANLRARDAVAAGAEEIAFRGVRIESASDLAVLFSDLERISICFEDADARTMRLLAARLKIRPHGAGVSAGLDPLVDLALSAELMAAANAGFVPFTIHAEEFQERGATSAEQVGFALAAGADFMAEMQERGVALERAAGALAFSFAIGPAFFVEIAKLRAFRMLWARVVESFGGSRECAVARVYARTVPRNGTSDASHMNILRGTTEAMAAVLGGADSVWVAPFEECGDGSNDLGRRLARNTQIILKREAKFAQVADAAGGSYSVEAITDAIAAKTWRVLQEIEAAGGYRRTASTRLQRRIGIED